MGTIVFLAVLAIASVSAIVVGFRMRKTDKQGLTPKIILGAGGVVAGAAMLIAGLGAFYTQDPGEAVVVKSFTGEGLLSVPVLPAISTPGMNALPFASWNALYDVPCETVSLIIFSTSEAVFGSRAFFSTDGGCAL